jgi:uncharacterized protein YjbJ (UPF0337 family)
MWEIKIFRLRGDFLRAEGSIDKMVGIIQERFGDTKEAIQKKLDRLATE